MILVRVNEWFAIHLVLKRFISSHLKWWKSLNRKVCARATNESTRNKVNVISSFQLDHQIKSKSSIRDVCNVDGFLKMLKIAQRNCSGKWFYILEMFSFSQVSTELAWISVGPDMRSWLMATWSDRHISYFPKHIEP